MFLYLLFGLWQLWHYYLHYFYRILLWLLFYSKSIISIISFRTYYFDYIHYDTIIWIIFLSDYYHNYGFPILLYALFFSLHIISIITIMVIKIIDIIRIIDIIAVIYICFPPEHSSGIWLQILGLTAGMHLYTCEEAIAAKILRNPGGRCTSVLAGTRKKQAFNTVLTTRRYTSWMLQSRIFGRMFILPMHCRENQLESSELRQIRR